MNPSVVGGLGTNLRSRGHLVKAREQIFSHKVLNVGRQADTVVLHTKPDQKCENFRTLNPYQVMYHLALHMVFTFHSLSNVRDVAHIMMTLDVVINFHCIDFFSGL